MIRIVAALAVTAAGITCAAAQTKWPDASQGVPPGWTLMPTPATPAIYQPAVKPQPFKRLVSDNYGGKLESFQSMFELWNARGDVVEITGWCGSACTLVMQLPRDRICFGHLARLAFHMAHDKVGNQNIPSVRWSQWMIDKYPADIQAWIEAKGGASKLPITDNLFQYWQLPAAELWKMGYKRCE